MAYATIFETDVWVKIINSTQEKNLLLIKKYAQSHPIDVDFRDRFQFPFDERMPYDSSRIYKFDIRYDDMSLGKIDYTKPGSEKLAIIRLLGTGAQFVVDEDKVILRAFYPLKLEGYRYSHQQRERIGDDFLEFLIENNIDIAND